MPYNRYLPLYDKLKQDGTNARPMEETAHSGLLFDKFCDHWSGPRKQWKPEKTANRDDAIKYQFMKSIIAQHSKSKLQSVIGNLLTQYHARRDAMLSAIGGKPEVFTTDWRFVSGLGMGHVLETGFVWHRTLGVPYLPGSSVKGLIRASVDPAKGWNEDKEKWKKEYLRLFGDSDDTGAGALIVFDAIPETKPTLEVDIMNPHYGAYYGNKKQPPADYLSPVPIFFLTVAPNSRFKFALAPRPGAGSASDLATGFELLKCALATLGAGAKTAVGYGYFS